MNKDWKYCPYCGNKVADCECDSHDDRFPSGYAEGEYSDFDSAEAIDGARFDDANFSRYYER